LKAELETLNRRKSEHQKVIREYKAETKQYKEKIENFREITEKLMNKGVSEEN